MKNEEEIKMPFGKFEDWVVKEIPNSYLRWLITVQNVPEIIREEARKKLEQSDFDNTDIEITRHALDMFSKRFLDRWRDRRIGLGTFVARMSMEALNRGKFLNDKRNIGKGAKFYYDGLVWVFSWSDELPQYKALITVMPPNRYLRKVLREEIAH